MKQTRITLMNLTIIFGSLVALACLQFGVIEHTAAQVNPPTPPPGGPGTPCTTVWNQPGPLAIAQLYQVGSATFVPLGFSVTLSPPPGPNPGGGTGGPPPGSVSSVTGYDFDWGDGSPVQPVLVGDLTNQPLAHVWPAYGVYTIRYRQVDNCGVSPWYTQRIPVHEWRLRAEAFRGELDKTSIMPMALDPSGRNVQLILTNGQSSRVALSIVDEEGTVYARGSQPGNQNTVGLRWSYCDGGPNPACHEGLPTPPGLMWSELSSAYAEDVYYLPWYQERSPLAISMQTSANAILFDGLNIQIMPIGSGIRYQVQRPTLSSDPSAWQNLISSTGSTAEQTQAFKLKNESIQPGNEAALFLDWQASTSQPWLVLGTSTSGTLGAGAQADLQAAVRPAGLAEGSYTGQIEIRTNQFSWSPQDPWPNSPPPTPSLGTMGKAFPDSLLILVGLRVGDVPCDPVICPTSQPSCAPNCPSSPAGGYRIKGDIFSGGSVNGLSVHPSSVVAANGTITVNGTEHQVPGYSQDNEYQVAVRQTLETLDSLRKSRGRQWLGATGGGNESLPTSANGSIMMNLNSLSTNPFADFLNNTEQPEGGVWVVTGDLELRAPFSFKHTGTIIVTGNIRITGTGAIQVSDGSLGLAALGNQGITITNGVTGLNATAFLAPNGQIVIE